MRERVAAAAFAAALSVSLGGVALAQGAATQFGGDGASGVITGGSAGATSSQPGAGGSPGSLGSVAGAEAELPRVGPERTETEVLRRIPGREDQAPGAAAGAGATGLDEAHIRDSLRAQGYQVESLVRRGDVWEGRVTRNGRTQTLRVDPLTGQPAVR